MLSYFNFFKTAHNYLWVIGLIGRKYVQVSDASNNAWSQIFITRQFKYRSTPVIEKY